MIQASDSNSPDAGERRKWRAFLAAGIVLAAGSGIGILGTALGMVHAFRTIETLKAPTPDDLAAGVNFGFAATAIGVVACAIGVPLVVVSCVKLARFWEPPRAARSAT